MSPSFQIPPNLFVSTRPTQELPLSKESIKKQGLRIYTGTQTHAPIFRNIFCKSPLSDTFLSGNQYHRYHIIILSYFVGMEVFFRSPPSLPSIIFLSCLSLIFTRIGAKFTDLPAHCTPFQIVIFTNLDLSGLFVCYIICCMTL